MVPGPETEAGTAVGAQPGRPRGGGLAGPLFAGLGERLFMVA